MSYSFLSLQLPFTGDFTRILKEEKQAFYPHYDICLISVFDIV